MKEKELVKYLGYSIKHKELGQTLKNLKADLNLEKELDYNGYIYNASSNNTLKNICLSFVGYKRYLMKYGEAKFIKNKDNDELILTEIDFYNDYNDIGNLAIPFSIELPFNLIQGDSKEEIIKKLNKKPKEKTKTSNGFAWWFHMEGYKTLVSLNKESKLIWLRFMKLDQSEITKAQLIKEIGRQRKNINPEHVEILQSCQDKLPTYKWRERMKNGDNLFTPENIIQVESILKEHIGNLIEYTKTKKASNIFNSIKKIVLKINKINDQHNGFIETLEREELCEFIDKLTMATGFKIKDNIDLTLEWREW